MTITKTFGCLRCGKPYEVTQPDDIYIEARSKYKKAGDYRIEMEKKCNFCENRNTIYWYKPESN
jgi:hypothetical protein